jgi:hypothetical protein
MLFSGAEYGDRMQQIFAHRYKYLTDRVAVILNYWSSVFSWLAQ